MSNPVPPPHRATVQPNLTLTSVSDEQLLESANPLLDEAPATRKLSSQVVTPKPRAPRLEGLDPSAFAHEYDGNAMAVLKRLRGFDYIVGKLLEWQHERGAHVELTASSIRVTERQLPRINSMLVEACHILDMEEPELYVSGGPVNALTSGHNKPYIVLYSGLVDTMDDSELRAVIGHELGHIKCNHVLYKEIVRWLTEVGMSGARSSESGNVAVKLALPYVRRAMIRWDQMSELSADRAAMLVAQDKDVCIRMLLKLAGAPIRFGDQLDTDAFLEQARRLQDLTFDSQIAKSHRQRLVDGSSHPLTVERARQLDRWIEEGAYDKVRLEPHLGNRRPTHARSRDDDSFAEPRAVGKLRKRFARRREGVDDADIADNDD